MDNYRTHKRTEEKEPNGTFTFIKNNFGWVKDLLVIIGLVGVMYLQSHYVTLEKFEASTKSNNDAHIALIATMTSMDKTLALMGRNQSDISDLTAQVKIHTSTLADVVGQNKIDAEYNNLFKESATKISDLNNRMSSIESLGLQLFMRDSLVNRAQLDVKLKSLEDTRTEDARASSPPK